MVIRRIASPGSRLGMGIVLASLLVLPAWAITPSAYEHYQRAVQLEKGGDFRSAEREYRLALALDPYDSLTYTRLAYLVERDGKKDEAIQLIQQALALNPKDSMLHLSLAQLWESKNQPAKALEHYQLLLKGNPDYSYAYLPKARAERTLKQNSQAIESYQRFLNSYPKHPDAQRELASLLMSQKQYSEAAEVYKNLKSLNIGGFKDNLAYGIALNNSDRSEEALAVFEQITTPSVPLYEQMGMSYEKLNRLPEAYHAYEKAIALAPKEKYDLYLRMADISTTLNRLDEAIASLQAYLKYNPKNGMIIKNLADLQLEKKDYAAAETTYQNALSQLPASEKTARNEALRNLGFAQQMQDRLDEAVASYEKALALEDNHQVRLNLALAYHKQEDYQKAKDFYRKLLVEDPDSPTLRKDLGQVLLALADQALQKQDYKEAMSHYQDAFLLGDEQEVPALLGMANTQYALKNYPIAYSTYQKVLERDPINITARINKARLDLNEKNYMEALENLRWIVQEKPDFFDTYKMLAQTHEALGDYGQAIIHYQKALEIAPSDSSLLIGYGNAWRQVGDLDRAQKAYELARIQSPENAMIRYNLGSIYSMKDQLDASLAEYRSALQLNPSFVEPYYGMGVTLEKQKRLSEALDVYQQYIQKASPSSSYVPAAKQRVEALQEMIKPKVLPSASSTKPLQPVNSSSSAPTQPIPSSSSKP